MHERRVPSFERVGIVGVMSRSKRWKGMDLEAGGDGITVERRRDSSGFDWLCDLWLAERPADAVRA